MRFLCLLFVVLFGRQALAEQSDTDATAVQAAIERGMAFLVRDALAWKKEHNCVSCHHAALVVWSLREAKLRGLAVDEPVLAELTQWMAQSGDGKVSLPRPEGRPKAFNSKALYFSLALAADPQPDEPTRQGRAALLATVKADQTEDGAWSAWPDTRPPIFGPSDDTLTSLAALSLLPAAGSDVQAKNALDRAVGWLDRTECDDDPQSLAMRLVLWRRIERPEEERRALAARILERQSDDGGWRQAADMPSDAWATGQALYALAHAGLSADAPAVARGRAFLVRTQRDDGAWPMTSRPSPPSGAGATSLIPITGAGSAWAVLGLVRSQ